MILKRSASKAASSCQRNRRSRSFAWCESAHETDGEKTSRKLLRLRGHSHKEKSREGRRKVTVEHSRFFAMTRILRDKFEMNGSSSWVRTPLGYKTSANLYVWTVIINCANAWTSHAFRTKSTTALVCGICFYYCNKFLIFKCACSVFFFSFLLLPGHLFVARCGQTQFFIVRCDLFSPLPLRLLVSHFWRTRCAWLTQTTVAWC